MPIPPGVNRCYNLYVHPKCTWLNDDTAYTDLNDVPKDCDMCGEHICSEGTDSYLDEVGEFFQPNDWEMPGNSARRSSREFGGPPSVIDYTKPGKNVFGHASCGLERGLEVA